MKYQFKEEKDLVVEQEGTFDFQGLKINYAILKNKKAVIANSSIYKMLKADPLELNTLPERRGWMSKNKWNNSLYLKEIPEFLISIINSNKSETLVEKAKILLMELSHLALKALTDEKEELPIEEEEIKKEPTFDQLLGALMKVPPPKNEKK